MTPFYTSKGRSVKGSMLNISTKKKYEEKKRKGRERKRLSKMRKLEQIGQLSPAPTREETKTEETET